MLEMTENNQFILEPIGPFDHVVYIYGRICGFFHVGVARMKLTSPVINTRALVDCRAVVEPRGAGVAGVGQQGRRADLSRDGCAA